jgi:LysR family hydrogen peroxide-inducible transcriptional activator
MQIQKLEEELGVKIFDRSNYPVRVTEIGIKIIEQAREIIRESRKIKELADAELGIIRGRFRLGIIPTIAPFLLPRFVERFVKKYDKLNLVFDEIQTEQIIEKLKKDQLDAAILATPLNDHAIIEEPIYYEPFVGYVSKEHKLYSHANIDAEELELDDLWLLKQGHCFRDHVINICKQYSHHEIETRAGVEEHHSPTFEGGTIETLRKLVENNFGMTLLPYLAVKEIEEAGKGNYIKVFNDPVPKREISVVYHKSNVRKHIIEALKQEIISVIPEEILLKENSFIVKRKRD